MSTPSSPPQPANCSQTRDFPTTSAGINRAIAWVARRTGADLATLWVIEGAASYGALLAAAVGTAGYPVAEAARMDARAQHGHGKSDPLDAHRIAAAVLPLQEQQLRRPRLNDGIRAALRVLVTARESMTGDRTRSVNALTALARVNDLGLDARKPLTGAQILEISRWRARDEPLALSVARSEAVRLAKRISELDTDIKANSSRITELVEISEAAPLLQETGFGPVTAAICLTAWSHQGRVRSEAAFASLAVVSPIPASSGNTVRHRLNRGGERKVPQRPVQPGTLHLTHGCRRLHLRQPPPGRTTGTAQRRTHRRSAGMGRTRDPGGARPIRTPGTALGRVSPRCRPRPGPGPGPVVGPRRGLPVPAAQKHRAPGIPCIPVRQETPERE